MEDKPKQCKEPYSGSHPALCESGTDFWVGGDLITYAHSQLRVMLNPAALTQMTQNNTEQNVKKNRTQNNTAKKITRYPKYICNGQQSNETRYWLCLCCVLKDDLKRDLKLNKIEFKVMWPWEKFTVIFTDHIRQVRLSLTHKPPRTSDDISIIFLKPPVADTFQPKTIIVTQFGPLTKLWK